MNKNLIKEKIDEYLKSRDTQSLHIDEVISSIESTKKEYFYESINLFNTAIGMLSKAEVNVKVELQIELETESRSIKGVPLNEEKLIENIDMQCMPELFIFTPKSIEWPPKIEMYISPLPFSIKQLTSGSYAIYEEYRIIEDLQINSEFTRWLTFGMQLNL